MKPFRRFLIENGPHTLDSHVHTDWTDGKDTVRAMHKRACENRLQGIVFSEHVRNTSHTWFADFASEVRRLAQVPCRAFVGAETKVLTDRGDLDIAADSAAKCDVIIASVHRFPGEHNIRQSIYSPEQALELEFNLLKQAINNPLTQVLGHAFGMSRKRFAIQPHNVMWEELIARCAKNEVIFEINAKYHDNALLLENLCKQAGVLICFGSDAHAVDELRTGTTLLERP